MSRNVSPRLSSRNSTDRADANLKPSRQLRERRSGCALRSNHANGTVGEFRCAALFSARDATRAWFALRRAAASTGATFLRHVAVVVGDRAKEHMGRTDTTRIISIRAIVADAQALRDRAVRQFPRIAMRLKDSPLGLSESAVFVFGGRAPEPAPFCLLHLRPEPFGWWFRLSGIAACVRTILSSRARGLVSRAAELTDARCWLSIHAIRALACVRTKAFCLAVSGLPAALAEFGRVICSHFDPQYRVVRGAVGADYTVAPRYCTANHGR